MYVDMYEHMHVCMYLCMYTRKKNGNKILSIIRNTCFIRIFLIVLFYVVRNNSQRQKKIALSQNDIMFPRTEKNISIYCLSLAKFRSDNSHKNLVQH